MAQMKQTPNLKKARGLGPQRDDGVTETVVVRPNEGEKWERAKFRFRSSLFALVTLVDTWAIHFTGFWITN